MTFFEDQVRFQNPHTAVDLRRVFTTFKQPD
ncbi:MAG: hypothetical protein ACI9O5_001148 [Algoriphagus sp.]|jgi:hypothetical protein